MNYAKNHMIYGAGSVVTDADGFFRRLLPPGTIDVNIALNHPDFVDDEAARPSMEELTTGKAMFVMKPALSLSGMVHDTHGQPIENVLLLTAGSTGMTGGDQEPLEDWTTPRTDRNGRFTARGLSEGSHDVVVSSDDYVPVQLTVSLTGDTKPLDITLNHGVLYTAKVVDNNGNPIVGGTISCHGWHAGNQRETPLARFTKTTADGSFTLANLPKVGSLDLYAGPSKREFAGMNFHWSADGKNHDTITLYPYPVISGHVVDAGTGNPICIFKVEPGWDTGYGFNVLDFEYSKTINPGDGSFNKRIDGFAPQMEADFKYQVRISASGYTPALSPPVRLGEKSEPFVIKLKPAGQ